MRVPLFLRPALLMLAASLALPAHAELHKEFKGVGRDATDAEVKAWDIDVRPDFKGLPPGSGSVSAGETLWTGKCASCHGDFGDDNQVFTPLVGNTTAEDIASGRVASLKAGGSVRTTFTKVNTVSTLWDYIHRAMPWDAPKSLSNDDVYAVLAYLLNLAEIVPADYVLSDKNIAEVQARMPNRNGMTREHGLWEVKGKPDTLNKACMKDCQAEVRISSALPDYARNAHGNLADQNRTFGAVRGRITDPAAAVSKPVAAPANATVNAAVTALLGAQGCTGCHGMDRKIIGPGFKEIAEKYQTRADVKAYLADRISKGGSGVWGTASMPPQAQLSKPELESIAAWLAAGAQP
jgi:cytochrome c